METWADESGYVLSCRGDKSKSQTYIYCRKVGRPKQHHRNAAQSGILPEHSRTVPTFASEKREECCPYYVYIARGYNGMREERVVSRLQRKHAPQTAKQKKIPCTLGIVARSSYVYKI